MIYIWYNGEKWDSWGTDFIDSQDYDLTDVEYFLTNGRGVDDCGPIEIFAKIKDIEWLGDNKPMLFDYWIGMDPLFDWDFATDGHIMAHGWVDEVSKETAEKLITLWESNYRKSYQRIKDEGNDPEDGDKYTLVFMRKALDKLKERV